MTIVVNGTPKAVADGADVAAVVRALGEDPQRPGTAVARNGEVVPRSSWTQTRLQDGDRLEVVHAVQGG